MKSKGRPATRPIKLKDGFYVEVRNKGSKEKGVKIRSVSKEAMDSVIAQYQRNNKEVIVLGEHKDEVWLNDIPASKRKKAEKAKASVLA